jgi:hypothetical protein
MFALDVAIAPILIAPRVVFFYDVSLVEIAATARELR